MTSTSLYLTPGNLSAATVSYEYKEHGDLDLMIVYLHVILSVVIQYFDFWVFF